MAQGPAEAVKRLATHVATSAPPEKTRTVLREIIVAAGWFAGSDADDKADEWLGRFTSRVKAEIDTIELAGGHVAYAFNSSGTDYIQGSCYIEPGDDPTTASAKEKRARTPDIFQHFRSLTAAEFELLSGRVLSLLGVQDGYVSKASSDQGIDFFGRLGLGHLLKPTVLKAGGEKHLHVWLVGQSKHYPDTKIGTAEIRGLVGSIELARAKIFAGSSDPLAKLTVRLCDPIIYLFFTTGRFSRDSVNLLERSGVLAFDGQQLGQLLADSGVGLSSGAFDAAEFQTWLHS